MNFLDEYLQVIHEKQDKRWIQKAISKPGALHKALGVPKDEKISADKLKVKPGDSPKMEKRKNLAKTLKKMHHEGEEVQVSNKIDFLTMRESLENLYDQRDQVNENEILLEEPVTGRKTVMSILGIVLSIGPLGPVSWVLYRAIRGALNNCSAACGAFRPNDVKRQYCMLMCKYKVLAKLKDTYEKEIKKCKGDDCDSLRSTLSEINNKMKKLMDDIKESRKRMHSQGKDTSMGDRVSPDDNWRMI